MTTEEQREAYLICKVRGHQPGGFVIDTFPPIDTCQHCGTTFNYEQVLHEYRTPFGWTSDIKQKPDSPEYKAVFGGDK